MPRPFLKLAPLALALLAGHLLAQRPEDTPALPVAEPAARPAFEGFAPVPIAPTDWLAVQVELTRRGFSCGSIDGVRGGQTAAALKAFQLNEGLSPTGEFDLATREVLLLTAPVLTEHVFDAVDEVSTQPVPDSWLGKSQVNYLAYGSALEMIAERYRANPKLLVRLNPAVNWDALPAGVHLVVPAAEPPPPSAGLARIHIYLAEKVLHAVDEFGRILLHCPVSIARDVEKRPVGELRVTVVIPDPNYTFDPVVFPESAEGRELGRRLIIPPGPNNPVGVAWIGLNRTGYGVHGTPDPEKVGRTESHGCFRLANWDARTLVKLARVGLPVLIDP